MVDIQISDHEAHRIARMDIRGLMAGWDYVAQTQTSTTDKWTYRQGGASGRLLGSVTITYTDSTKATIDHVAVTQWA